jgi:hypothetical protein
VEFGGESGEQDGDFFVQFSYAVVVGEDRGEGAEARKVLRRQAAQAEAEKDCRRLSQAADSFRVSWSSVLVAAVAAPKKISILAY